MFFEFKKDMFAAGQHWNDDDNDDDDDDDRQADDASLWYLDGFEMFWKQKPVC